MRSLRSWAIFLVVVVVASAAASSLLDKPGDNNDALPAELANILIPLALLGLVVVAVVAFARTRRSGDGQ